MFLNPVLAAMAALMLAAGPGAGPAQGQDGAANAPAAPEAAGDMATLLADLRDAENGTWRRTERQILLEWSRSGSAAMDLLLQRGRDAMRDGDTDAAIEHLTALTDHAPDFAEGWNARATAFFNAKAYGPSVADIARTLTLNPHHFGALSGLGMIFEETGDKKRALEAYRAALAIHPRLEGIQARADRLAAELEGQDV